MGISTNQKWFLRVVKYSMLRTIVDGIQHFIEFLRVVKLCIFRTVSPDLRSDSAFLRVEKLGKRKKKEVDAKPMSLS